MNNPDRNLTPESKADSSPSKSMIYVVDDDFDVLKSLRFLLETEGFDVRTFRSGPALLSSDARNDADCFVIDYKMPYLDGLELTRKLRELNVATPIVLFTGYPDEAFSAKAATAGVRHVLFKPHLEDSLIGQVRLAMQKNGLRPQ